MCCLHLGMGRRSSHYLGYVLEAEGKNQWQNHSGSLNFCLDMVQTISTHRSLVKAHHTSKLGLKETRIHSLKRQHQGCTPWGMTRERERQQRIWTNNIMYNVHYFWHYCVNLFSCLSLASLTFASCKRANIIYYVHHIVGIVTQQVLNTYLLDK